MGYYSMAYMYQIVRDMYDSDKWRYRVRNMSDNQIMAIFYDHLEKEEARKAKQLEQNKADSVVEPVSEYPKQLSFFD